MKDWTALGAGFLSVFLFVFPLVTGAERGSSNRNVLWALVAAGLAGSLLLYVRLRLEPLQKGAVARVAVFLSVLIAIYAAVLLGATYGLHRPEAFFLPLLYVGVGLSLLRTDFLRSVLPSEVQRALIVLVVLVVAVCVLSGHQQVTFIGSYFRRTGLIAFFGCVIVFLVAVLFGRSKRGRRGSVLAATSGAVVVSVVALWQFFDPAGSARRWFTDLHGDPRAMGTMGQTNWFGTYLCLILPLAATMFLAARTRGAQWGFLLCCASVFAALLVGQTRGAWVAAACFLIWFAVVHRRNWRKVVLLFATFAVVGLVLLPARDFKIWNRMLSMQKEVDRLGQGSAAAGTGRWGFWMYGLKHLPPHVILGSGLDTFEEVGLKEIPPPPVDKAHSIYVEYALTLGLPGLAAYLYFLWACVRPRGRPDDLIHWGLQASIVTYLIQGIFIHDTIHTWPLVWIIAGLAAVGGGAVSGVSFSLSEKCLASESEESPTPAAGAGFA